MSKLRPCPFCGGTDIRITEHPGAGRGFLHEGETVYSMCCYHCGATFPNRYRHELLVECWNRRAEPAQQDAPTDVERAHDAWKATCTHQPTVREAFYAGWGERGPAQEAERERQQNGGDVEAIAYTLTDSDISIERVMQRDGTFKWAVRRPGCCMSTGGDWEWEPSPSSRTDEWIALHRFDTAQGAFDAARAQRAGKEAS